MENPAEEQDKYYSLDRITSISTTASTVAWVFLAIAALLLVPLIYTLATSDLMASGTLLSILFGGITQIALALVFVFFFIILRAISEILYLLLDIEEGINPPATEDR